jgi:hypothetical protein
MTKSESIRNKLSQNDFINFVRYLKTKDPESISKIITHLKIIKDDTIQKFVTKIENALKINPAITDEVITQLINE